MSLSQEISAIIKQSVEDGWDWEFNEAHEDALKHSKLTIPGRIFDYLNKQISNLSQANRVIGLVNAFCLQRVFVDWKLYYGGEGIMSFINRLIEYWLQSESGRDSMDRDWLYEIFSNDERIYFDRYLKHSHPATEGAFENAVKFTESKKLFDATNSMGDIFIFFDECISDYEGEKYLKLNSWISEYAVPVAFEFRKMTLEELLAYTDIPITYTTRRKMREYFGVESE